MGHANGVITAPVNTDDVAATIGVNSHDVGTLCSSADRINKWARNKPENTGGPEELTDAQRKANNFGLRMLTTFTTVQSYVNQANTEVGLSGWTYEGPTASNGGWYRLTDFINYRTDSLSPFPSLMQGDYMFGTSTDGTKVLNMALAAGFEGETSGTDYIRISDLNKADAKYSDWYAGVLLMTSTTNFYLATSTTTISNGTSIQFKQSNGMVVPAEGTYKAFVFLANKVFSVSSKGSTAVTALQLIPLTQKAVNVNLITSASALTVQCAIQGSKIAVTVTNKNTTSVKIIPVEFQHSADASGSNVSILTSRDPLTEFSVPAGSTASPSVVTKTYRVFIVGKTGFVRFAYKQQVGAGTTSANLYTPWTALFQEVG